MENFKKSQEVMEDLFAKDYQFALATSNNNIPEVRFIDTFYDEGCFYVVTYKLSNKVKELENNPDVALCRKLFRFKGIATNIGHPLKPENSAIREKLIHAFEPWYFAHNNENDENMCYVKIELSEGFFYKNGTGYKVNFKEKKAEAFPFDFDITLPD